MTDKLTAPKGPAEDQTGVKGQISKLGVPLNEQEHQEILEKELSALGIETTPENIATLKEYMETPQHPEGFEEILSNMNSPDTLKAAMEKAKIHYIVHVEGATVWDHVKLSVQEIDTMDISDDLKYDLKLLMFYHDLGKTEVWNNEENTEKTKQKLEKGELHRSMIGHAKAKLDEIRERLQANGIEGKKLERFMMVVKDHMKTSIPEQEPKKTAELFEPYGENDEERKEAVRLLTLTLQADGNSTNSARLIDGELQFSKNEKKLALDLDAVWGKYEEGKEVLRKEQEKQKKKEAEAALETAIFGGKLSDYLIKERGLHQGKEMGKAIGRVKGLLAQNKDKPPEEIKVIIDGTEL